MKKLLLYFLILLPVTLQANEQIRKSTRADVQALFGPTGAQLPTPSVLFLEDLLYDLAILSDYQTMQASKKAAQEVWNLYKERIAARDQIEDEQERAFLDHALFVFEIQAEHFERAARIIGQKLFWWNIFFGWLKNSFQTIWNIVQLPKNAIKNPIDQLADDLYDYSELERAQIFGDHNKTLRFLVKLKKVDLPLVLKFWDYPGYLHQLLTGVKKFQHLIKPLASIGGTVLKTAVNVGERIGASELVTAVVEASYDDALASFGDFWQGIANDTVINLKTGAQEASDMSKAFTEWTKGSSVSISRGTEFEKVAAKTAIEVIVTEPGISDSGTLTARTDPNTAPIPKNPADTTIGKTAVEDGAIDTTTASATKTAENKINTLNPAKAEDDIQATIPDVVEKPKTLVGKIKAAWNTPVTIVKGSKNEAILQFMSKFSMLAPSKGLFSATKSAELKAWSMVTTTDKALTETTTASGAQAVVQAADSQLPAEAVSNSVVQDASLKTVNLQRSSEAQNLYIKIEKSSLAKMIVTAVDQSELMMGGQMVGGWKSLDDEQTYINLIEKQMFLNNNLSSALAKIGADQHNAIQVINNQFTANIAQLATQFAVTTNSDGSSSFIGALPTLFAAEQSLLASALVNTTVKQVFLTNSLQEDEQFSYASMILPATFNPTSLTQQGGINTTWYNMYRYGNWQFSSTNYATGQTTPPITSFIQYTAAPMTSSAFPNGDPNYALYNTIFCDYIPTQRTNLTPLASYTITIQCTLLAAPTNPFMLGIIFNGARWISGIVDLHRQHRLFCIYNTPSQKAGTYSVGFAETFYQSKASLSQQQLSDQTAGASLLGSSAVPPTIQLLAPDVTKTAIALMGSSRANLITNPVATIPALTPGVPYTFTIQTQPTQVLLSITGPNGAVIFPQPSSSSTTPSAGQTSSTQNQPATVSPLTINNLNDLFYIYHSIGLMAANCTAQFIIQSPTALQYSPSQIQLISSTLLSGGTTS